MYIYNYNTVCVSCKKYYYCDISIFTAKLQNDLKLKGPKYIEDNDLFSVQIPIS